MKKVFAMLLCTLLLVGFIFPVYATENSETQETTEATTAATETKEEPKPTENPVPETSEPTQPVVPETSAPTEPAVSEPAVTETTVETTVPTECPAHIDGCDDECTGEDCECGCHAETLFERLMAVESLEDFQIIVNESTEEELDALSEEQEEQINLHVESLLPILVPADVFEESEPPVQSEIVAVSVNYADAAPIGNK